MTLIPTSSTARAAVLWTGTCDRTVILCVLLQKTRPRNCKCLVWRTPLLILDSYRWNQESVPIRKRQTILNCYYWRFLWKRTRIWIPAPHFQILEGIALSSSHRRLVSLRQPSNSAPINQALWRLLLSSFFWKGGTNLWVREDVLDETFISWAIGWLTLREGLTVGQAKSLSLSPPVPPVIHKSSISWLRRLVGKGGQLMKGRKRCPPQGHLESYPQH